MSFPLAASLLSPNFGLVIWITIVFLILLFILRRFAWGPITGALEEREKTIDESIQRAERALEEAKQIQADNERARREAEQEAQRLLREAREEAERLRTDEVQKTRDQIQQMRAQAQAEIEREKILQENLDAARQRKLVDGFISDLPEN